jgi:nitrite reductase/ring-hydroxylating ferredoxin subunit
MPTGSKIKHFFICLTLLTLLISCERNKNDVIPDEYVDFTIDILDYPVLESLTGSVSVDASDMRIADRKYAGGYNGNGIIIYRSLPDEFNAYDRTCPHDYAINNLSKKVTIDFTEAICPQCSTHYSLSSFGTPVSGPGRYPLKNYKTRFDGRYITVWNY